MQNKIRINFYRMELLFHFEWAQAQAGKAQMNLTSLKVQGEHIFQSVYHICSLEIDLPTLLQSCLSNEEQWQKKRKLGLFWR